MNDDTTTKQVKNIPNPEGKGGFGEHPENRNNGRWDPKNTFQYQFNRFKNMTVAELKAWQSENSEDVRTVAEDLAFTRIVNSKNRLDEFQEVSNRTEGRPIQRQEMTGADGGAIDVLLNKIERTNYADVAKQAKQQMVENNEPVQNQGQTGGTDNIPTE